MGTEGPGGRGSTVLVHETATSGAIWDATVRALPGDVRHLAPDRPGWGSREGPEGLAATSVGEQSEAIVRIAGEQGIEGALFVGAGFGAVVALDLVARRPDVAARCLAIEPPLHSLMADATEGVSRDALTVREALEAGGPDAVVGIYLEGGLPTMGAGAERLPEHAVAGAHERGTELIAELVAVPGWSVPLEALRRRRERISVATAASTPELLERAAGALSGALGGVDRLSLPSAELPPHLGSPGELAAAIAERAARSAGDT